MGMNRYIMLSFPLILAALILLATVSKPDLPHIDWSIFKVTHHAPTAR
jgi:hypothetical protein